MSEWRGVAERLVELDLAIEDLNAWATTPGDIAELARLEDLRDDLQAAVAQHWISRRLRQHLEEHSMRRSSPVAAVDPRD
jgi:hypothetical protein